MKGRSWNFAGSIVDELSTMGQGLVIPALSGKIRELFGFDFSELLAELSEPKKIGARSRKKRPRKRTHDGERLHEKKGHKCT